jgi:hypothetical protein
LVCAPDAQGSSEGHPLDLPTVAVAVAVRRRQVWVDEVHDVSSLYDGVGPHHEAPLALGPAGAHRLPPGDELQEDDAERVHVDLVAHLAVHEVLRSKVPAMPSKEIATLVS